MGVALAIGEGAAVDDCVALLLSLVIRSVVELMEALERP